eukprot:jgi/Mesvir1/14111/Mv20246-RA.1
MLLEVKEFARWTDAVGQLLVYGHHFPGLTKVIVVFDRDGKEIAEEQLDLIEFHMQGLDMMVCTEQYFERIALFNAYAAGVLQKQSSLVKDPYHAVFDPIDINDILSSDTCSLVISIPYDRETPESTFPVAYKVDSQSFGEFNVNTQKNGNFVVDLSSMYHTTRSGGWDMRTKESQLLTFTLPSYKLPVDGGLEDTLPSNSAAYITRPPPEVRVLFKTNEAVMIPYTSSVSVPYMVDGVMFGNAAMTAHAEGLMFNFGDMYGNALNTGYDMFAKELQFLSFNIPPSKFTVSGEFLTRTIPFGFYLLNGVGQSKEFHTVLDGVTGVQLEVIWEPGQPKVVYTLASLPNLEMSNVYLDQLVPYKKAEMALEIITTSPVTVPSPLTIPFYMDGVEFGTAAVTGVDTSLRVDFGGLYTKLLTRPEVGYDMFTKREQGLTFIVPAGSVKVGESLVGLPFSFSLPINLE